MALQGDGRCGRLIQHPLAPNRGALALPRGRAGFAGGQGDLGWSVQFKLEEGRENTQAGVSKATHGNQGVLSRRKRNEFGGQGGALSAIQRCYSAEVQRPVSFIVLIKYTEFKIQLMCIECLQTARHYSRLWGHRREQNKNSCPHGASVVERSARQ